MGDVEYQPEWKRVKIDWKNVFSDASGWTLILSNIVAMVFALAEHWDLRTVLIIYWSQSVIIGFFNFIRILSLKNFTTKGMTMNNQPVPETEGGKLGVAVFFLFHYGFFHLVYFMFLVIKDFSAPVDYNFIYLLGIMFFINHLFSFLYNYKKDSMKRHNLGAMMFFPYIRIIPMHLIILAGAAMAGAKSSAYYIILFTGMKTAADFIMHVVEHAEVAENGRTDKSV